MASSRRIDSGMQSGNDTQYLFSEGDVHDSDADRSAVPQVAGRFTFPVPLSFCELYLCKLAFLHNVFPHLRFSCRDRGGKNVF